ncbi:MAG: GerMN domain-containing protein [Actinomycetota bacterium]
MPVALVACGDDDDGSSTTTDASTTTTEEETTTTEEPAEETVVRAYFLRDERVGPVARTATGPAVAAAAMEGLLSGPEASEAEIGFSTTIPAGTELNGVTIADGVATVDLSSEFTSGGGSASMQGRVAQVVFTLTQFDTVDSVEFEVDGEPLTVLGGEGLMLDDPQTRADWEDLSPAILVESPLPFEDVTSPLRISGTGNTFEASFVINVTDGEGLIVYDEPAMATSGTGTRGTFDVTATFDVPREGIGSVIVFELSAKDGSQINVVEVPVRISG